MSILDSPLDAVTFAVVDVETTGLDPGRGDRVCEVAVVRGRGGTVLETWSSLVYPQRRIGRGAERVNRISNAMVRDAPPFGVVLPQLLAQIEGAVLVAHNAPFDLGFLRQELGRLGVSAAVLPALVVDTCQLARRCYNFPSNGLDYLGATLRVRDPQPAHRALGDVLTTWNLLGWLVADLRRRGERLDTLGDLLALQTRFAAEEAPPDLVPPLLAAALAEGRRLRAHYLDKDGRVSERQITPRRVTIERDTLYVVAYCHLREDERTFRLDRLTLFEEL